VYFEVGTPTSVTAVNLSCLEPAAEQGAEGHPAIEERPLVSIDYKTDPRSSIHRRSSTMVITRPSESCTPGMTMSGAMPTGPWKLARLVGQAN